MPGHGRRARGHGGQLCVYQGVTVNATVLTDGPSSTGATPNGDRFGFIAQITSAAAGDYQSRGTWAVTAP